MFRVHKGHAQGTQREGGHQQAKEMGPKRNPPANASISDIPPPKPQDNNRAQHKPPSLRCLVPVARAARISSNSSMAGEAPTRWSTNCVLAGRESHTTDPSVEVVRSPARTSFEVQGVLSLRFPSLPHHSLTHNVQHTPDHNLGPWARPGQAPPPTTSPVCLSNQPPLPDRTRRSHLSGVLVP